MFDRVDDRFVALGWSLQNVALRIVEPTMVGARDAALFDTPVAQRCAAVRAAIADQTDAAECVAEQHQVFAEQSHEPRRLLIGQLLGDGDWMPVTAQQAAGGRSGTNPCQQLIFLSGQHGALPVSGNGRIIRRYDSRSWGSNGHRSKFAT